MPESGIAEIGWVVWKHQESLLSQTAFSNRVFDPCLVLVVSESPHDRVAFAALSFGAFRHFLDPEIYASFEEFTKPPRDLLRDPTGPSDPWDYLQHHLYW